MIMYRIRYTKYVQVKININVDGNKQYIILFKIIHNIISSIVYIIPTMYLIQVS